MFISTNSWLLCRVLVHPFLQILATPGTICDPDQGEEGQENGQSSDQRIQDQGTSDDQNARHHSQFDEARVWQQGGGEGGEPGPLSEALPLVSHGLACEFVNHEKDGHQCDNQEQRHTPAPQEHDYKGC